MNRCLGFAILCLVADGCRFPESSTQGTNSRPVSAAPVNRGAVSPEDMARVANAATPLGEKYDIMIRLGWATSADKDDALRQAALFQERLPSLRQTALGKWAVVVRDQVFLVDSYSDTVVMMERECKGRQAFVGEIE
jgi:hypothetical protein